MLLNLRLAVPPHLSAAVQTLLCGDERVTNIVLMPGAALRPQGDAVLADVAREAAGEVIGALEELGIGEHGAISITDVDGAPFRAARAAGLAAPGRPDDGVVWRLVEDQAWSSSEGSVSYYVFLTLATALAAIAVVTDSSILVIGAMVVGPEFGTVAAIATGLALRRWPIVRSSLLLLLRGFAVAIAIVVLLALAARAVGWVTPEMVSRPRPLTGFIWHPDKWSFIVAILAGMAGVVSLTAGKSAALVGVFISVTTIPAAGNLAMALAVEATGEIRGSAVQLGLNLSGMVLAGVLTLLVQRTVWRLVHSRGRSHLRVR